MTQDGQSPRNRRQIDGRAPTNLVGRVGPEEDTHEIRDPLLLILRCYRRPHSVSETLRNTFAAPLVELT